MTFRDDLRWSLQRLGSDDFWYLFLDHGGWGYGSGHDGDAEPFPDWRDDKAMMIAWGIAAELTATPPAEWWWISRDALEWLEPLR